jgi:L-asparaginase / beta-aspartyl-peptidase
MYALAIHGGAGAAPRDRFTRGHEAHYRQALLQALQRGQSILERDGSAIDAVEAAVRALEDDPLFNAGRGAVLCEDGSVELDAAIMSGTDLRAGAVTGIRHYQNPVLLARRVLECSPHVFLAGAGAERFASEQGFTAVQNDYFITPHRSEQLRALRPAVSIADPAASVPLDSPPLDEPPLGTVGAVARDARGTLAAATSTGGISGKRPGRIGDSPVIGAGTYADDRSCAVSTTGHGEWFLRLTQAHDLAARMSYGGSSLEQAADAAIARLTQLQANGGLIAVDGNGLIVMRYNTPAMFRASVRSDGQATAEVY